MRIALALTQTSALALALRLLVLVAVVAASLPAVGVSMRFFPLVRLALRTAEFGDHGTNPLETLIDHREIGEEQLHVDRRDVAEWIDRSLGVRNGWIIEGTHDMDECARLLQIP
jgi:hypothetical protein